MFHDICDIKLILQTVCDDAGCSINDIYNATNIGYYRLVGLMQLMDLQNWVNRVRESRSTKYRCYITTSGRILLKNLKNLGPCNRKRRPGRIASNPCPKKLDWENIDWCNESSCRLWSTDKCPIKSKEK